MTRKQFKVVSAAIHAGFNIPFDPEKLEFWYQNLCGLDYDRLQIAIRVLVRTHTGVLNIADIINAYNAQNAPAQSALDALGVLNEAIRRFGRYRLLEAKAFIESKDPVPYEIVHAIGLMNVFNANPTYFNPSFERLYEKTADALNAQAALPSALKAEIAALKNKVQQESLIALSKEFEQ